MESNPLILYPLNEEQNSGKEKINKYLKKPRKKYDNLSKLLILIGLLGILGSIGFMIFELTYINFQTRLSFLDSNNTNNLVVSWSSLSNYPKHNELVYYTNNSHYQSTIKAHTESYVSKGWLKRYIHRVNLMKLDYNTLYNYHIKMGIFRSRKFSFTIPEQKKSDNHIIIYGDLGYQDSVGLTYIDKFRKTHNYDMIIHLGDLAYNLDDSAGILGDLFLSLIEKVAGNIPYLTLPGNHERKDNFSEYKNRFSMPDRIKSRNLFYTINRPYLKIINLDTEVFYFEGLEQVKINQFDFLTQELYNINRTEYPWVVLTGHRPMYCSNSDGNDCVYYQRDKVRLAWEKLLYDNQATIFLTAHEHSYERMCPIYDGVCQKLKNNYSYSNLELYNPIHIVSGSAGCDEGFSKFLPNNSRTIIRNSLPGFGTLDTNESYLVWKQYSIINAQIQISDTMSIKNDKYREI